MDNGGETDEITHMYQCAIGGHWNILMIYGFYET